MRYSIPAFLFLTALLVGYNLLPTGASRSKSEAAELVNVQALSLLGAQANANGGSAAVFQNEGFDTYAVAYDVVEGERKKYEGLSLALESVDDSAVCDEGSLCQKATLALVVDGGGASTITLSEGESVSLGGYEVRLSQIAPEQILVNEPYRAVILIAKQ